MQEIYKAVVAFLLHVLICAIRIQNSGENANRHLHFSCISCACAGQMHAICGHAATDVAFAHKLHFTPHVSIRQYVHAALH